MLLMVVLICYLLIWETELQAWISGKRGFSQCNRCFGPIIVHAAAVFLFYYHQYYCVCCDFTVFWFEMTHICLLDYAVIFMGSILVFLARLSCLLESPSFPLHCPGDLKSLT